jgi:hypothetical protein
MSTVANRAREVVKETEKREGKLVV